MEKSLLQAENQPSCLDAVSSSRYVKIFFTWLYFIDDKEILRTSLEVSFRQFNGNPISYTFSNLKGMKSDKWVKKFVKTQISDLSNSKLKAISKQGNYYVPTILYAMQS